MERRWKYLIVCAIIGALFLLQAQFTPPNNGGGGSGTVTSVIVAGTANQITASGTCTITTTGTCTLSLPASISNVTNLTPGADFTITQNSVVPFTSVSSGAVVNTIYLTAGHTLLGTTTDLGAVLTVADTRSTSPRGILSLQNSTDTVGARVGFAKSRGTAAIPTIVVTGDTLGRSMYRGYDGSNYLEMASIEAVATGTIASTRVPTYLAFSTATDATPSVLTERMRIDSAGGVTISSLTSGRVPVAGTAGLLGDDANFAFNSGNANLLLGGAASDAVYNLIIKDKLSNAYTGIKILSNSLSQSVLLGWAGVSASSALNLNGVTGAVLQQNSTAVVQAGKSGSTSVGIGPSNTNPTGTLDVADKTATTGATRVNIGLGAADSSTTNIFTIAGTQKFAGNNTTAAVAGVIGATCPAVTCTAAYTWVQAVSSDGSTVYFPVWK